MLKLGIAITHGHKNYVMCCVATCTAQHVIEKIYRAIGMTGRIVFREEKCSRVTGNIDGGEEVRSKNKWTVLLMCSSLRVSCTIYHKSD